MKNGFKITTEVRNILLASAEVTSLIGSKIFPVVAPDDTPGDLIIYQRDGYKTEYNKMGRHIDNPVVFVSAISESYTRSQDLASLIYEVLEGDFKNPNMRIRLQDSTEDCIEGKFIQVLQFSIELV